MTELFLYLGIRTLSVLVSLFLIGMLTLVGVAASRWRN